MSVRGYCTSCATLWVWKAAHVTGEECPICKEDLTIGIVTRRAKVTDRGLKVAWTRAEKKALQGK